DAIDEVEPSLPVNGQPADLGRSAADVEHDRARPVVAQQRCTAAEGKLCFHVAGDNLDFQPGLLPHAGEELVAVGGPPAGLGRDAARPGDAPVPHLAGADLERGHGAVHGRFRQQAGAGQPLAEPDDARIGVDHTEPAGMRFGNQEPAIVGAKVDRRQRLAGRINATATATGLGLRLLRDRHLRLPPEPSQAALGLHPTGRKAAPEAWRAIRKPFAHPRVDTPGPAHYVAASFGRPGTRPGLWPTGPAARPWPLLRPPAGGSSNGRTADSDSASLGSNPSP